MLVATGPYKESQPSCFDCVKMGFVMGCTVGMASRVFFGIFFCPRIGMWGQEVTGGIRDQGIGETMMQSGGTFGTFMAIRTGIRCSSGQWLPTSIPAQWQLTSVLREKEGALLWNSLNRKPLSSSRSSRAGSFLSRIRASDVPSQ
ncbi:reactive oxygen species modulator 1-like [Glossophaga mutica]